MGNDDKRNDIEMKGLKSAIYRSQAVIEFNLDGTIITANDNFLNAVGYTLEEVKGQHHRIFCDDAYAKTHEYRDFWEKLGRGEYDAGQYKRFTKNHDEIWIQASYNPILDANGKAYKVIKFATDITEDKMRNADHQGKIEAISKAQAVIEFNLDGTIITANDNFLNTVGYRLEEIKGQHHRIFCENHYANSAEYRDFWSRLNRGEYDAGQYKRIGKNGDEIWIQASYNPIMDAEGRPFKVVKFATNITEEKIRNADYQGRIEAVSKAQAVIEFNLDGTIITANDNFLNTVGYRLDEIRGQHHRMFCEVDYANSAEYRDFWKRLNNGQYDAGQYKRLGKNSDEIWIQASYNPILDAEGKPFKIVKFATNITEEKIRSADFSAQLDAIDKAQAVIEFDLNGNILHANKNFLAVTGYRLEDVKGQHHRMFCDPEYAASGEYQNFWQRLNQGQYAQGEYRRIGQGGREIWIQASYNPIMDLNGRPKKVVKYATDLTNEKRQYFQLVESFEKACSEIGQAAQTLSSTANQMVSNSTTNDEQAANVANSSENVSANIQGVSASTEEMSATVREIARSASETSTISEKASQNAKQATSLITDLDLASQDIGQIIKVISSIAQQTNLLALNATIEAARAGDSGRGFSVVANEVKELAKQTASATDDITAKIKTIQDISKSSADSIKEISGIIDQVNANAASTAAASEEQSVTTGEVAKLIVQSSDAVKEITQGIQTVASTSKNTMTGAQDTLDASQNLMNMSQNLKDMIEAAKGRSGQDKPGLKSVA